MSSAPSPHSSPAPHGSPAASPSGRRAAVTWGVSLLLLLGAAGYGVHWWRLHEDMVVTEDAYVEGNVVQVTPQTSGTVVAIGADNTDTVQAGQVLVKLNPVDARLVLHRAEAQLAKAVRQVRGQFSSASQMQALIELRQADLSRARADYERRVPLARSGAVSAEDFRHAEESVRAAQASLAAAQQQFAGNQALVERTSVAQHPDVVAASTQVRDAYIAERRTAVLAPVSGLVTRRSVQVGQRVSPGAALMSIVPLEQLWVTANFKESQLARLRVGQPVTLTTDVFGDAITYHGRVVGLDAGTGSAFSLMPAQNATGNWIKVVQRVPVRIALDAAELAQQPLRLGLSVSVTVDTRRRAGPALAAARGGPAHAYETAIFDVEHGGADELVHRIIAAQLMGAAPRALALARDGS